MNEELKPCPMCGGDVIPDNDNGESIVWLAKCQDCKIFFGLGFGSKTAPSKASVDRYNKRHHHPVIKLVYDLYGLKGFQFKNYPNIPKWARKCLEAIKKAVEE